jgi:hypothetical protein
MERLLILADYQQRVRDFVLQQFNAEQEVRKQDQIASVPSGTEVVGTA